GQHELTVASLSQTNEPASPRSIRQREPAHPRRRQRKAQRQLPDRLRRPAGLTSGPSDSFMLGETHPDHLAAGAPTPALINVDSHLLDSVYRWRASRTKYAME